MKTKAILSGIIALSISSAYGASYSVSAGSGADANGIADSSGTGFQGNGTVAIGSFGSTFDFGSVTSGAALLAGFTQLGSTGSFLAGGLFGNNGLFSLSAAGTVRGTSIEGEGLFLVVGNGSDFASSEEFLVLSGQRNFLATDDDSGTPADVIFNASSPILIGTSDPDIRTTGADSTVTPGFRTAVVPEPSVALLGALGVLGLARRRR